MNEKRVVGGIICDVGVSREFAVFCNPEAALGAWKLVVIKGCNVRREKFVILEILLGI